MRKRRLLLAVGACLATVVLTGGTALADPPTPPFPPVEGNGAQTTEGAIGDLCNNVISDGSGNAICGSWDVEGSTTVTPKDPAQHPECANIHRPVQGGDGFDNLIAKPSCWDYARVVTSTDKGTRPTGFTYIPLATDALTYAIPAGGSVPLNLDTATLKKIYQCDPTLTFPSKPTGFKPLIGSFGAGNRTLLFNKLGITDSPTYTTSFPCVRDKDANGVGLLANDGRVLTDRANLITYSSAPYFAQLNRVEQDIHGSAILGSINGIPPETLNSQSFIARTVYDVVRTGDISGASPNPLIQNLFVGPGSQVCSHPNTIQQHGFNLTPLNAASACGDTSLVTTN